MTTPTRTQMTTAAATVARVLHSDLPGHFQEGDALSLYEALWALERFSLRKQPSDPAPRPTHGQMSAAISTIRRLHAAPGGYQLSRDEERALPGAVRIIERLRDQTLDTTGRGAGEVLGLFPPTAEGRRL